jgi:hypothetical protein
MNKFYKKLKNALLIFRLADLNAEAVNLAETIQTNFVELGI